MKIHHIGYLAKRMNPAIIEFESLGFHIEQHTVLDTIRKVNICFMISGEYRIELILPTGEESPAYGLLSKHKDTLYHICYCTNDLEVAISKMLTNGFMLFQKPTIAPAIQNKKWHF